jgi:hypothetical protein
VASNQRNPVYDCPDEHELSISELASAHLQFRLVPSTRAQRRARAAYRRKVARSLGAAGQAAPSDQVVAADESAVV